MAIGGPQAASPSLGFSEQDLKHSKTGEEYILQQPFLGHGLDHMQSRMRKVIQLDPKVG